MSMITTIHGTDCEYCNRRAETYTIAFRNGISEGYDEGLKIGRVTALEYAIEKIENLQYNIEDIRDLAILRIVTDELTKILNYEGDL